MTQEQLAERADLGRVTVARIEKGAEPYVGTALALAAALEVRVEDIFTLDGSVPTALLSAERVQSA
jgi:DNA-binding XRE family transcriptional regulator